MQVDWIASPEHAQEATHAAALARLWAWADAGWVRRLDVALAEWVVRGDPAAPAALPWVLVVLGAMEGKGHSCLSLPDLHTRLAQWLDWPAEAAPALEALHRHLPRDPAGWRAALTSPMIEWLGVAASGHATAGERGAADRSHAVFLKPFAAHLSNGMPLGDVAPAGSERTDGATTTGLAAIPDATAELPPLVVHAQAEEGGALVPLRLYLRRYHAYEHTVAHGLLRRARAADATDPGAAAGVDAAQAAAGAQLADWLSRLFPQQGASAAAPAIDWQPVACALAMRQHLTVVTGGPGTGKTYTVARLLATAVAMAPAAQSLRIQLAAPTGKAAARLSESLQQALQDLPAAVRQDAALYAALGRIPAARTLHSLLGARPGTRQLRHHAGHPLPVDWLVVDEASMVDLQMMAALLAALPQDAHLVLLGDKDQLDSVEAGAVLGDVCAHAAQGRYGAATVAYIAATARAIVPPAFRSAEPAPLLSQSIVMLRESRRFGGSIGALAGAVQRNDAAHMAEVLAALRALPPHQRDVYWHEPASLQDARRIAWGGTGGDEAPPSPGHSAPVLDGAASYGRFAQRLRQAPRWPPAMPQSQAPSGLPLQRPLDPQWQATHAQWVAQVLDAAAQFRILCATRNGEWGVQGMNALVLEQLRQHGLDVRAQGWFAGRIVMVTRNDAALGIFNGDVGVALPSAQDSQRLRVYFPQPAEAQAAGSPPLRSIAVSRMQHVETAFAMTVHKSQGSEFAHVLLCLPGHTSPLLTRELLYTGLTRAKRHFSYLAPMAGIWSQAMAQRTQRASGLAALLGLDAPV